MNTIRHTLLFGISLILIGLGYWVIVINESPKQNQPVQYATPVAKENLPADVQKNSYIAYSRNGMLPPQNPYGRLYIMTSSGQDYGLIAEENYYIYSAWSSDGKYLAYTTLNKITILDMTDPQFYRVKPFYTAGQVPSYAKQQQNLDMSEVCESINSITWKPGTPIIVLIF